MKPGIDAVKQFTSQKNLAIVGVSRNPKKFGNYVFKELSKKDYTLYPVNPHMDEFEGVKCFKSIAELPDDVTAVHLNTSTEHSEGLIKSAYEKGIKNVWVQQGGGKIEDMDISELTDMNIIDGKCIMMFAEPVASIHGFHRFFMKVFGKYPK